MWIETQFLVRNWNKAWCVVAKGQVMPATWCWNPRVGNLHKPGPSLGIPMVFPAGADKKPLPSATFINQCILDTHRKWAKKWNLCTKLGNNQLWEKSTDTKKQENQHPQELERIKQSERSCKIVLLKIVKETKGAIEIHGNHRTQFKKKRQSWRIRITVATHEKTGRGKRDLRGWCRSYPRRPYAVA